MYWQHERMFGTMGVVGERNREPESSELEAEIAETCGLLNATTGRLVALLARVLESGCWQVAGIHSPTQWVAWQCGVSPARARALLSMARRRAVLPVTSRAHEAGELCEDQVAVICRHAPAGVDDQVAELARSATVTQLRRVLGSYPFAEESPQPDQDEPVPPPEEPRSVRFGQAESGSWRLSAELPPDEGALGSGPCWRPGTSCFRPARVIRLRGHFRTGPYQTLSTGPVSETERHYASEPVVETLNSGTG